ncbi:MULTISPECIES: hypothetical protein [Paraburkholderia]|jgi:hypothetical protein|uniref:hypothetical protein n=1 Tax=Paraburkholderia TaxID=1822464 RepID=UPI00141238AF|nr:MULTISPECIES: hypothetical protein [Paraburkholderia]MCX4172867.1 hypothetical protein [Paraburkholderia madseniana]MDQ6460875.1 hypothetical protein [Paraburkholderia madseniana]
MLSHVFVGITDFERAFGFYDVLMETPGVRLKFRDDDGNKLCVCCHAPETTSATQTTS